jgi:hypothetical protein
MIAENFVFYVVNTGHQHIKRVLKWYMFPLLETYTICIKSEKSSEGAKYDL